MPQSKKGGLHEELRAVGVFAAVRHRQQERLVVLALQPLVLFRIRTKRLVN